MSAGQRLLSKPHKTPLMIKENKKHIKMLPPHEELPLLPNKKEEPNDSDFEM